jgi:hypothetical protein
MRLRRPQLQPASTQPLFLPRPKNLNLHQLAWDLVDQSRSAFSETQLNQAFLQLGVGEYDAVIRSVLESAERLRLYLPTRLIDQMMFWVDGYAGHEDYRRLLHLVVNVVARRHDDQLKDNWTVSDVG